MKIWIVWLPNVWKSTLFNALTKNYSADAQNFPFCTIEPNIWIVNVDDQRLEKIRQVVNWQKIIPATVEFIDIAWIVSGASSGEWLWNKFLAHIREANVILQIVRIFENNDIIHVDWKINPKTDIEVINTELIIADIETIEKRLITSVKKARSDKKIEEYLKIYKKVLEKLKMWILAIDMWLNEDEKEALYDLHLLTNKIFIYGCNVSEDMMNIWEDKLGEITGITNKNIKILPVCAKLEEDMIEMTKEERNEFLQDMWLSTTWLDDLIKSSYDALWLQYYFTAWEQEVRAWTIHAWDTAPKAAWVIHTDFEKWFIKADVVNWEDIVKFWGWIKARENGKVSLEWKDYIVKDGDVILFKFKA